MRFLYTLIFFCAFSYTEDEILPDISPGLQFGCNANFDIFISAQLTMGAIVHNGPVIGTTFGKRIFYTSKDKGWNSFIYNDYQIGHLLLGLGLGRVFYSEDVYII